MPEEGASPLRKIGLVLLIVWAALLVLGAVGELFDVEALRWLDPKRIFLN